MKKVFVMVLFSLFVSSPAWTQSQWAPHAREVLVFQNTPLFTVLNRMSELIGRTPVAQVAIPSERFTGDLNGISPVQAFEQVLTPYGLRAEFAAGEIRFILNDRSGATPYGYPAGLGVVPGMGDGDRILARNRADLYASGFGGLDMTNPYRNLYSPVVYPSVPYGYYGSGYAEGLAYFFSPCRSFMPSIERPVDCVQASLSFDIRESYLDDATLRIDGYTLGRIGNYKVRPFWPDKKLLLGSDREHTIEITRFTADGHTQVMSDRIKPETIKMTGNNAIKILVSEGEFANAPYGLDVTPTVEDRSGKEFITGKP